MIQAEVDKAWLKDKIARGRVAPLDLPDALDPEAVDAATRIVAQMGDEPFQRALDLGAEVVIAGRACDASVIAALPVRARIRPGPRHPHGQDPRVRGRRRLSAPRLR